MLILKLVQAERVKRNHAAQPFVFDTVLTRVARERSADMAARNAFAHANAAGENPYQIVAKAVANFRGAVGENIMTDTIAPGTPFDPAAAASRVVAAWLASPPHAANIAAATFDKIGVGVAEKGGTVYVTLVFTGPAPARAVP